MKIKFDLYLDTKRVRHTFDPQTGVIERVAGGVELPVVRFPGIHTPGAAFELALDLLEAEKPLIEKMIGKMASRTVKKAVEEQKEPDSETARTATAQQAAPPAKTAKQQDQDNGFNGSSNEPSKVAHLVLQEGESVIGELVGFGRWTDYRYTNQDGYSRRYGINIIVDGRNRRIWGSQLAEAVRASGVKKGDRVKVTLVEKSAGKSSSVFSIEKI